MNLKPPSDPKLVDQLKRWWPKFLIDHERYKREEPKVESLFHAFKDGGWR